MIKQIARRKQEKNPRISLKIIMASSHIVTSLRVRRVLPFGIAINVPPNERVIIDEKRDRWGESEVRSNEKVS